ncbi:hypothetical protein EPD60_11855 [Flaviaesturariibacter flavus]|uniref:DUF4157 domain-containing protein n=1 Tax=Flaviaesturariibacter flavus TaxID=2502780 RepID=A0A4V2NVK0_9BACT|nr:hypothetical protein [Flaviaesturariibacter flavus]TCJ13782.1 hypothetical protein EPD60_11855 [Flaviaesturariibacter flavus]
MKLRLPLTVSLCFVLSAVQAQQFGAVPPSVRWQQIRTDTAQVVFAAPAGAQAQRIAGIVHRMAAADTGSTRFRRIPIVLHNNTTLANGYVSLAPFRSEYYLVPGSNIFEFGNLPWNEQLAVHEYRHVQQYNRFNRGLSLVAGTLLGQEGRSLFNALSVPDWYFEGDAVYAETVFSPQGRGRQPWFFNNFESIWKEGRNYSWAKLRNGSYRDQVPNHYPLGYLLVNYGREKYGAGFWTKVTNDAASFKGLFYPFQRAVLRYSGQRFKDFRKEALESYGHQVSRKRDEQATREVVTHYEFPSRIAEDTLLYLKYGFQHIPGFYERVGGKERRIALRSISTEDWLSYRNGTVAYTATSTHPRWSLVDYSDIVLLNTATGKEERITRHQKYFTPALSPDGSRIVAVQINDSLQASLQLLDRSGKVLQSRRTPAGALFVHPQFYDAGTVVVGIRHPGARMSLALYDIATQSFSQLLPPTSSTIGYFYPAGGKVYFTSSLNGTDDLYELDVETKATFRLTTGGVGHYFASVGAGKLQWSDFTGNGFRIQEQPLSQLQRIEVPVGQWGLSQPPFPVAGADSVESVLDGERRVFAVQPYKGGSGLINVHSWRPYYEDPEFTFSIFSDNVLNTFSNELFYRYNINESAHSVGFNTSYGGLFTVLSAGVEHTFNRTVTRRLQSSTRVENYSATDVHVGYYVPLNFTRGKTYRYLRFGTDLVFNWTSPVGATKGIVPASSSAYLSHLVAWTQVLPRAHQQLFTRLGYSLVGNLRHRLDGNGYLALGTGTLYLPGVARTHSLQLQGSIQQVDTLNRIFSNRFANSRGYEDYFNSRMWRLSANYHLPLLYPEIGAANIVYLSRIRGNGFFDLSRFYSNNKQNSVDLKTIGAEVYFDTKWWNQYPVSVGLRYSYLLDAAKVGASSPHVWEIVLPISLLPR